MTHRSANRVRVTDASTSARLHSELNVFATASAAMAWSRTRIFKVVDRSAAIRCTWAIATDAAVVCLANLVRLLAEAISFTQKSLCDVLGDAASAVRAADLEIAT